MSIPVGHRKSDGKSHDPLRPELPRTRTVRLRVAPLEAQAWEKLAQAEGRSLSELVREVVNRYVESLTG